MSKHTRVRVSGPDGRRLAGGVVIGALASGAMALGALGSAGDANATCVSAGGWFTIGSGCTTTDPGDFALAIGRGATATATGGENTALAFGNAASATAQGFHNVAVGSGLGATAEAIGGYNNTAIAIGDPATGSGGGGMQAAALQAKTRPTGTYARAGLPVVNIDGDGRHRRSTRRGTPRQHGHRNRQERTGGRSGW